LQRILLSILVPMCGIIAASCDTAFFAGTPAVPLATARAAATAKSFVELLEQNRAKWESQNITHYQMLLDLPSSSSSYDRMPLTVEVKDSEVIAVVDARGETVTPEDDEDFIYEYPGAFTISGLFTIADQTFQSQPPLIIVTYDPSLGYPATIHVDPYWEPCCQEYTYIVRDLQILPP
jgi:hypothetical protein